MSSSPSEQSLRDRIVLITGAAGGLGSTAAKASAQQKATVILLDNDVRGLERVYDDIVDSNAPTPGIYPFDLEGANEQHYHELVEKIETQYGGLGGLMHCATHFAALGPISTIETNAWSKTIAVNLNAVFLLTQVLLPLMERASDASILFVSDSSARKAKAYWGAYAISKIAMEGFATILAEEYETAGKLRVNTLIPGAINSSIRRRAYPGEERDQLPGPESLSDLITYLLGPLSKGVTGQIIESDFLKVHPCASNKV